MKPPLTTIPKTIAEVKKTWMSIVTGWTQPAPKPDISRMAAQLVKDRERKD